MRHIHFSSVLRNTSRDIAGCIPDPKDDDILSLEISKVTHVLGMHDTPREELLPGEGDRARFEKTAGGPDDFVESSRRVRRVGEY